jgi:hypothetical protein
VILVLAAPVAAAAPGAVRIEVAGACPDRAQVERELNRALPDTRIVDGADHSDVPRVEVADMGARYHARVNGTGREFIDETRRCDERARTVAVFAALMFESSPEPAHAATPAPAPKIVVPPLRETPASPATPAPSPSPLHADLEIGAALAFAPANGDPIPITYGGAARASVRVNRFGIALGIAARAPATIPLAAGLRASAWRVPLDLDARIVLQPGRLMIAGDLGLVLDVITASGEVAMSRAATAALPGIRAALWIGPRFGRIIPFLGAEAEVFPLPPSLLIDGKPAGSAPILWLSLTIGIALSIR